MRLIIQHLGDANISVIEISAMTFEDDMDGKRIVAYSNGFGKFVCSDPKIVEFPQIYAEFAKQLAKDGYCNMNRYEWVRESAY